MSDKDVGEATTILASVSVNTKAQRNRRSIFSYGFVVDALGEYHDFSEDYPIAVLDIALALGRDAAPRVLRWAERALLDVAGAELSYSYSRDPQGSPVMPQDKPDDKITVKFSSALDHIRAWAKFERNGYVDYAKPQIEPTASNRWHRPRPPPWTANMGAWDVDFEAELSDAEREMWHANLDVRRDDNYVESCSISWLYRSWGQSRRRPQRADVIGSLEQSLYLHGALNIKPVTYSSDRWETAVMVSVRGVGTARVIFLVSMSEYNICDPGCWCAGTRSFVVSSVFVSDSVNEETGEAAPAVDCHDLIYFSYDNGEASGMGGGEVSLAGQAGCDATATALGIAPEHIGVALRVVVLAANVRGNGCRQWDALEMCCKGHAVTDALYDDFEYDYETNEAETSENSHCLRRLRGGTAVDEFPFTPKLDDRGDGCVVDEIDGNIKAFKIGAMKYMKKLMMKMDPAAYVNLPTLVSALRLDAKYRKPMKTPLSQIPMTTISRLQREQARLDTKAFQSQMFGDY